MSEVSKNIYIYTPKCLYSMKIDYILTPKSNIKVEWVEVIIFRFLTEERIHNLSDEQHWSMFSERFSYIQIVLYRGYRMLSNVCLAGSSHWEEVVFVLYNGGSEGERFCKLLSQK